MGHFSTRIQEEMGEGVSDFSLSWGWAIRGIQVEFGFGFRFGLGQVGNPGRVQVRVEFGVGIGWECKSGLY